MNTMLNNKKPTSIDFSDTTLNDNKLASDEMEKLLAHALSSRQRELEQLVTPTNKENSKSAEEWITGSNDPVTNALNASIAIKRSNDIKRPTDKQSAINKKNVSFNEDNNEEISYEKDVRNHAINDTIASRDTTNNTNLSFLSKLKRTNMGTMYESDDNEIPLDGFMTDYEDECISADTTMQPFAVDNTRDAIDSREYAKLDEKINKIQNYIESIKQTQDTILELLSKK
jgi:hypothetical protein